LGKTEILIDGGGREPGVVAYLNDYVEGAIEAMVATHPHADHIGGLIAVLDAFEVEEIWLNGDTSTSKTFQEFMSRVNAEEALVNEALRGQSIEVGDLALPVLHPVEPFFDDTNNNSIVLSLSYGKVDFLFTGDAEKEAEESMLDAGIVPEVEVLKVGHHGSSSSSCIEFLSTVRPDIAIYMAGEGNRYGHPHDETIVALSEVDAEIYGTDVHGTIIITTDGETYILQLEKRAPPRAPPVVSPIPSPAPTPPPAPVPEQPQVFEVYLKPGSVVGASFSISKVLEAGEEVSGFVEIYDPQSHDTDYSYDYYLEVLNPEGKTIYSWKGNYEQDNNHEFSFNATDTGKYIIKITHHSNYRKALYVKILPPSWASEK